MKITPVKDYIDLTSKAVGEKITSALAEGIAPNAIPLDHRYTAWWWSVMNSSQCLKLLIDAGADVNAVNAFGLNALQLAVRCHRLDNVKLLLAAGAKVDAVADDEYLSEDVMSSWLSTCSPCEVALYEKKHAVDSGKKSAEIQRQGRSRYTRQRLGGIVGYLPPVEEESEDDEKSSPWLFLRDSFYINVAKVSRYWTSLMFAARSGWDECVKVLLDAGAEVHAVDKKGRIALMLALSEGSVSCVGMLLDAGADVNALDAEGKDVWLYAESKKSRALECVHLLLAAGADADSGVSCFAGKDYAREIVRLLLDSGADVHAVNEVTGRTLLIETARTGDAESVKKLLAAGVSVNHTDHEGRSALSYAAEEGRRKCVISLLSYAAEVNAVDERGCTALWYALMQGHVVCGLRLIDAGADVHVVNSRSGRNLLSVAIERRDPELMKMLLAAGVEVNLLDRKGCTALMYAAENGCPECVSLLLKAGADVNYTNAHGENCLMIAAQEGNLELVQYLLSSGKAINKEFLDMSLIHAKLHGREDITHILLSAGASDKGNEASSLA